MKQLEKALIAELKKINIGNICRFTANGILVSSIPDPVLLIS